MSTKSESSVFDYFRENYLLFPIGEVIYQDKPDYLVKGKTKLIGIEITEAVINPSELSKYRFQVSLTDDILNKLKNKLPFTFCICVSPKKDANLPLKKKRKIINDVTDLCYKECINLQNLEYYRVLDFGASIKNFPISIQKEILAKGYRNLPEGILEISIGRYDSVESSWNSESTAMVVPNFNLEKLKQILKKKEIKLQDYTKCDEQWLIIWGSGLPNSYYNKIEINEPVETEFDKIFFVKLREQITEIKLKKI